MNFKHERKVRGIFVLMTAHIIVHVQILLPRIILKGKGIITTQKIGAYLKYIFPAKQIPFRIRVKMNSKKKLM